MKNTTAIGKRAENLAVQFLKQQGYEIIERNYRNRFCEIDIIAKNHNFISFVEVKFRNSKAYGGGLGAINPDKQRRLQRSAEYWLSQNQQFSDLQPKVDIISIDGDNQIMYLENALF